MKKFGLIGKPIAHSLSPALFKAGYNGAYPYELIETDDFASAYRRFLDEYDGINVTAPYKEDAFARADIISPECRRIGATNLLLKTPEGIKAYNTDYYGILLSILESVAGYGAKGNDAGSGTRSAQLPPRPTPEQAQTLLAGRARTALVVGCGGAGKAAAFAAVDLGLEVTLMNRTASKAETLADIINAELPAVPTTKDGSGHVSSAAQDRKTRCKVKSIDNFAEAFLAADIIIYTLPEAVDDLKQILNQVKTCGLFLATPQHSNKFDCIRLKRSVKDDAGAIQDDTGSHSKSTECCLESACTTKFLLEANYRNPSFTPEVIQKMSAALSGGRQINYIPGSRWLLYQAYAGYDLFTGLTPSLSAMSAIL